MRKKLDWEEGLEDTRIGEGVEDEGHSKKFGLPYGSMREQGRQRWVKKWVREKFLAKSSGLRNVFSSERASHRKKKKKKHWEDSLFLRQKKDRKTEQKKIMLGDPAGNISGWTQCRGRTDSILCRDLWNCRGLG